MTDEVIKSVELLRKYTSELILAIIISGWLASLSSDLGGYEYFGWILMIIFASLFIIILVEIEKQTNLLTKREYKKFRGQKNKTHFLFIFSEIILILFYPLYIYTNPCLNINTMFSGKLLITIIGWFPFYFIMQYTVASHSPLSMVVSNE